MPTMSMAARSITWRNCGFRSIATGRTARSMVDRGSLQKLESRGLVRLYDGRPWLAPCGLRIESIEARHDDPATFGFRIEARSGRRGPTRSLGYLADTGMWTAAQADALADVDLLGVEFNHDVELQKNSGRPPFLVRRVLGNRGHLSNAQGADLVRAVVSRSRPGRLRSLVLLHLSEQCNCPDLARETAARRFPGGPAVGSMSGWRRPDARVRIWKWCPPRLDPSLRNWRGRLIRL